MWGVLSCLMGSLTLCRVYGELFIAVNTSKVASGDWVRVKVTGVPTEHRTGCWIGVYPLSANFSRIPDPTIPGDTFTPPWTHNAPIKYIFCDDADPKFTSTGNLQKDFTLLNLRTPIVFVLFFEGTTRPVPVQRSDPVFFTNPDAPMHVHIARTTEYSEMMIQWVSPYSSEYSEVRWGTTSGKLTNIARASNSTFAASDLCGPPATNVGWFDPGYLYYALIKGLTPETQIFYQVGDPKYGWSEELYFRSEQRPDPKAHTQFLLTGDIGASEKDGCRYHWRQPIAETTYNNLFKKLQSYDKYDRSTAVLHVGDLSYATGYLAKWDLMMHLIEPIASHVPYMIALGNHEMDWPGTGTDWVGKMDSGGECGVPARHRFKMPSKSNNYWYSFDQGSVHVSVLNTELDLSSGSEQYRWLDQDLKAVNRAITPWLVVAGHRPMYYVNQTDGKIQRIENLLFTHKVDVAIWGHVHNVQVTCPVIKSNCIPPSLDYDAPIHVQVGNGGMELVPFPAGAKAPWSVYQDAYFGFAELVTSDPTILYINIFTETNITTAKYSHAIKRDFPRNY